MTCHVIMISFVIRNLIMANQSYLTALTGFTDASAEKPGVLNSFVNYFFFFTQQQKKVSKPRFSKLWF